MPPTLRELWDKAALFVPVGDARALQRALEMLIADPQRMHRLAEASWARARQYEPHTMGRQYLALYRELLNVSQPRVREVA